MRDGGEDEDMLILHGDGEMNEIASFSVERDKRVDDSDIVLLL